MGASASKKKTSVMKNENVREESNSKPTPDMSAQQKEDRKDSIRNIGVDIENSSTQVRRNSRNEHVPEQTRKNSRMEKLKSRKLPLHLRFQAVDENDEEDENHRRHSHPKPSKGSSDHGISHLEKLKRRKMPVNKRLSLAH